MTTDQCDRRIIRRENVNAAGELLQKYLETHEMAKLFKAPAEPGWLQPPSLPPCCSKEQVPGPC
jgi:hypothetical protein